MLMNPEVRRQKPEVRSRKSEVGCKHQVSAYRHLRSGNLLKAKTFLMLIILCLAGFSTAQARVYLDFTSPNFRKVPTTIPYFVNKAQPQQIEDSGRKMAAILAESLEFHGFISILPIIDYGGNHDMDWRKLGADLTILGKYIRSATDLSLELQLIDTIEGRRILGKIYKGPQDSYRKMVLRFCDEVIKELTGEPGISQSKIAFTSDKSGFQEVYLADILGDEVRQVTKHRRLVVSPKLSPDGKRLAYTSYHSGNPNLYVTDLSQQTTTRAISRRKGLNLAPAWSNDAKTMVLTLSQEGNPDLYLMTTEGKILRKLTQRTGINVSPSWSPDGNRLAFVSDRSGTPQIYIMNIKNGRTNRITFLGNDNSQPSWSPQGDWLAYTGLFEGSYHIFIIRPDARTPVRVTKYAGNHESPVWSPDGNQLAFSRRLENKQQLYVAFKNGTGLRRLFHFEGRQAYPQGSGRMVN